MARKVGEEKAQGVACYLLDIDQDFLSTYGINLLAGRNFRLGDHTNYGFGEADETIIYKVLINETAARKLGFTEPGSAINQRIIFKLAMKEMTHEVIGIVHDYHQQSLQKAFDPIIFLYPSFYHDKYLTININTQNVGETIESIEEQYADFFPHDPFSYFFLDGYFNRQYQADLKFGQICLMFSGLAIFIAALELFGLGSYMALQKVKEISIRKVMGATLGQMLILIPTKLLRLVLVSGLLAIPVTYFVAQEWLKSYAFKIGLNPWMFLLHLLMVFLVAILSVLLQSFKVAMVNPADSLRNE